MTTQNPLHEKADDAFNTPSPEPQEAQKPDVGLKSGKQQFAILIVGVVAMVGLVVVARMYT
ncbi:MAG: hypothetical protein RIC16_14745 [Rhodospirillales bacterium]